MFQRIGALAVLVVVIAACSGTPTTGPEGTETLQPGATETAAATETAGETEGGQTNPPAGDLEAKARALAPPGSTETGKFEAGGFFQLYLTSTMSIQELEAFYDQKIPSLGMTVAGKFTAEGTLTYSITNPDGGVVASPDSASGGVVIVIALGTSS